MLDKSPQAVSIQVEDIQIFLMFVSTLSSHQFPALFISAYPHCDYGKRKTVGDVLTENSLPTRIHGLAAFRNMPVHDYLGINLARVWKVIERDLPDPKTSIINMVQELGNERWEN